jgi:hypothetical protein
MHMTKTIRSAGSGLFHQIASMQRHVHRLRQSHFYLADYKAFA